MTLFRYVLCIFDSGLCKYVCMCVCVCVCVCVRTREHASACLRVGGCDYYIFSRKILCEC